MITDTQGALDEQLKKKPNGNGPLPEIELWQERFASLSALVEQLKLRTAVKILAINRLVDYGNMDDLIADLNKYFLEAKDNVRFLFTLERHFKNITYGASFQVTPPKSRGVLQNYFLSRGVPHYYFLRRIIFYEISVTWFTACCRH